MASRRSFLALAILLGAASLTTAASAEDRSIVVASTTSTQDSGLFGYLLPLFKAKTGIDVKVIAQGTGQALDTARRGDADVVFVHAKPQEERFVTDGYGVKRFDVMVITQGTRQALDTARRGDADVVFVHAKPQEERVVTDGYGVKREKRK